jgi:hypothetical protein
MSIPQPGATRQAVAVIMERKTLQNRWISEKWEAKGVVSDNGSSGTAARLIVESAGLQQYLHAGREIRLQRHEAQGYYLNITSPQPKVFVLWRMRDSEARPELLTVSYEEGARWLDSGEQVDGVALPAEWLPWIADFVSRHYEPEEPKRKRYASNRDHGRMGRVE